jgi:2-polyprenyl-3-methyl-5-hydroxy-6-metoxy-1,4-benzoquinol methylase
MKSIKEKIVDDFNGHGEMIEIPCSKYYTNKQSLYICKNTGLVRAKVLRTAKEIADAWSNEVYSSKFDNKTYTARIPAVKARHTYVADFAHMHLNLTGKTVCDIGAGEGQFFEIISGTNYQANCYGIEPSKKNCQQLLKKGFNCYTGTIEEYSHSNLISKDKFDVITIMWTLG